MQWFLNLSTRGKLFLGFGLMILFLATIIATAYMATGAILQAQRDLYGRDFRIAMENIKLASSQNVASTKQAEVAAQNLNSLGQKMQELVAQLRV